MQPPETDPNENDDLEMRWPETGDRAFVTAPPIYGARPASDVRERLWRMIRGYRHAADMLVTETDAKAHLRSDLIYPIVFSYRHSLELVLKQLLEDHGQRAGHKPEFRNHRLEQIWPYCREVIEHFNPGADSSPLDTIENIVAEFSQIDPASYNFRYASDTNGKQIDIKIICIDLSELREVMAGIHNFLECVDLQINHSTSDDCDAT